MEIMTPKQKLKSLERKMATIQKEYPEIDLVITSRFFWAVEKYFKLKQEHFLLEFEINHCEKCGKKL
jgi:hypothetical protein